MKQYTGAMIHVRIGGPGIENCKSANLKLDEENAKIVADALAKLNEQCDLSEFVGWVTYGYVEDTEESD